MSFTLRQDYIAEFYLSYKDIMAFWEQKYPDRIINLNYEELVNDFQKKVRELFEKLELSWEDQLYDFHKNNRPVHTASFKQVRSKIFKNAKELILGRTFFGLGAGTFPIIYFERTQ